MVSRGETLPELDLAPASDTRKTGCFIEDHPSTVYICVWVRAEISRADLRRFPEKKSMGSDAID